MKKLGVLLIICMLLLSSCRGNSPTEKLLRTPFEHVNIDRVIITGTRNAVKYTVVDSKSISRIRNMVTKGRDASIDTKLESDFEFEFYDGKKTVASYRYIAGVNDKDTGNLIDKEGRLYHITTSIEDEFIKRVMRKSVNKNVPEYYISLIEKIIEKTGMPENSVVLVDTSKDYTVAKYILSMEQKRILDSIDKEGIKMELPGQVDKWNYMVKIATTSYTDVKSKTNVTVIDGAGGETKYYFEGTFKDDRWDYYIRFK